MSAHETLKQVCDAWQVFNHHTRSAERLREYRTLNRRMRADLFHHECEARRAAAVITRLLQCSD